ncbi:MAG: sugar ABC transporter permease, partial [Candidatus Omnitrophota bacterium]
TIMSFVFSFQVFEQVYIMTGDQGDIGGVLNSGLTIVAYLYDKGFQKFQMGYASALAYIIFLWIFVLTMVNKRFMKSEIRY